MTALAQGGARAVDPVLIRLPGAAWHALPALGVLGIVTLGAWVSASWLFGTGGAAVPVVVAAAAVIPAAWAIGAMQRGVFDPAPASFGRRVRVAALTILVPAGLASWSSVTATLADASGVAAFRVLAVGEVVAALVAALVGVVALPIGAARSDVGIGSIVRVAVVAAVRRPLLPFAALVVPAAVAWTALTWFGGLTVLVAPLLILLAVPASWAAARALGVALPALAPIRRRSTQEDFDG